MQRLSRRIDPDLIAILLLLSFGLVAYSNSFLAAFHFDDFTRILENDAIIDLTNLGKIYSYCKERFLTYFTLALNYRISKFDTTSYHIFNFLIHYSATFFLYFLLLETFETPAMKMVDLKFSKRLAAFLVAGIFLLHPLQTQSVTYVIQRAESMAGMFYLATLFFYVKGRLTTPSRAAAGYYVLMILSGVAASFSKATAVTLPAMIVVYEMFFFNTSIRELVRKKIILFAFIPAGVVVAYKLSFLLQRNFYYDPGSYFTRKQYFLTQFSVLVTYLRLFFWPANQNLDWDYPVALTLFNARTLASLSLLIALVFLAILAYRKHRLLSLGIIGFFVTLAPTSSIIPIKDLIYEHRMYLAVAFLAIGSVYAFFLGLVKLRDVSPRWFGVVLCLIIGAIFPLLASLTYARNEVWRSELSLWQDALQKSPNKFRPHVNYGRALHAAWGDASSAKKHYEIASRLCSHCYTPYHNLAFIYWEEGNYQQAIALELEAIRLKPDYDAALYQMSRMYRELQQWDNARIYLERLVKRPMNSRFLQAYVDLLDVYLHLGLDDKSRALVKRMTSQQDGLPRLDYFRGVALYKLEDFAGAKYYLLKQTESGSERNSSLLMLGKIYYLEGEYELAEATFRKVLEGDQWSAAAHNNLAIILEKSGRFREASEHWKKVLIAEPFSIDASIRLVTIYNHLGDTAKRTERLGKILRLKPNSKEYGYLEANEAQDLSKTLSGYRKKFLSGQRSTSSHEAMAIVATLEEDFREAVEQYQRYLVTSNNKEQKERVAKEVLRLEGLLRGEDLLKTPA
jgi:tetratricopeptide (TPR) repeat protein